MNTLGKRQDNKNEVNDYNLPAVIRDDPHEIPLKKAIIISTIAHPAIVALIWLLLIVLAFLGINLVLFEKPKPKMRDLEFVLVNKPEQKPLNPNTKYRSDRNSRAGGKHNPNLPVSEPEPSAAKSTPQRASAPAKSPSPQKMSKPVQQHKASRSSNHNQQKSDMPAPPRPVPYQGMPKPMIPHPGKFNMPMPKIKAPKTISPRGGPVTSGPIGDSSPSSSPSPIMSSSGGGSRGTSRGHHNNGYSLGGGNAGNPSPGNPNGNPGIDAVREPDWGSYMRELQRRIKRNWNPPRGDQSKRVVLSFTIARDGRLLRSHVLRSSGNSENDRAAISAVQLTAPFRPLPPEFRGPDIDIEFTFDYNVISYNKIQ